MQAAARRNVRIASLNRSDTDRQRINAARIAPCVVILRSLHRKGRAEADLGFASRFSLQLLDRGFSLFLGQLLLKTLRGFPEAGISVDLFGAAQ